MAGLKIMLAIVLAAIAVASFFPMADNLIEPYGQNAVLGLIVWLAIFAAAAFAVNSALPKRARTSVEANQQ